MIEDAAYDKENLNIDDHEFFILWSVRTDQ